MECQAVFQAKSQAKKFLLNRVPGDVAPSVAVAVVTAPAAGGGGGGVVCLAQGEEARVLGVEAGVAGPEDEGLVRF